jgi:hypothetical protein
VGNVSRNSSERYNEHGLQDRGGKNPYKLQGLLGHSHKTIFQWDGLSVHMMWTWGYYATVPTLFAHRVRYNIMLRKCPHRDFMYLKTVACVIITLLVPSQILIFLVEKKTIIPSDDMVLRDCDSTRHSY